MEQSIWLLCIIMCPLTSCKTIKVEWNFAVIMKGETNFLCPTLFCMPYGSCTILSKINSPINYIYQKWIFFHQLIYKKKRERILSTLHSTVGRNFVVKLYREVLKTFIISFLKLPNYSVMSKHTEKAFNKLLKIEIIP